MNRFLIISFLISTAGSVGYANADRQAAPEKLTPAPSAVDEPDTLTSLQPIDPSVYRVESGGFWQEETRFGTYRVVVRNYGYDRVYSHVFIDWMLDEETGARVALSVPIPEFNDSPVMSVGRIRFPLDADNNIVEISAMNTYSVESFIYRFELGGPGTFRLVERRTDPNPWNTEN